MANTSRVWGFRASRYIDGSPWNGQTQAYAFSASQANDAFMGDLVQIDTTNRSTGITDMYLNGVPVLQPVVAAATTNKFRGVIAGFVAQPEFSQSATASLGLRYRVASTARYAWIVEDQAVVFEAEESGNSYTSASNNGINKVVDISYTAGNTTTGISKVVLDATTVVSNAVKPWRIQRYTQRVDNFGFTASDANSRAKLDVTINNSDQVQASNGA